MRILGVDPGSVTTGFGVIDYERGRLVLVEGVWGTVSPVGMSAERLRGLLAPLVSEARLVRLSDDPLLWGREVEDERYAIVARL